MKTRIFAMSALVLLVAGILAGCGSPVSAAGGTTVPDATRAYVRLGQVTVDGYGAAGRTVFAGAPDAADLTDVTLYLVATAETQLATASTLSELRQKVIEVENPVGQQTFKLTAKHGSGTLSGTATATLTKGKAEPLSFTLNLATGNGDVRITVAFDGDATYAEYTLDQIGGNASGTATPLTVRGGSVTVSTSAAPGTYDLAIMFYGDSNKTAPLNTYREIVRVDAGCTSSATRSISLNELRTIRYHVCLNGVKETKGHTIDEAGIAAGSNTTSLPLNVSRKSAQLPLPTMAMEGYVFMGWFTTDEDPASNSVSTVLDGKLDYYARFADTLYVNSSGNDTNAGYTTWHPLKTLQGAVNKIAEYNANIDWKIVVMNDLSGAQTLSSSNLTVTAKSITVAGMPATVSIGDNPYPTLNGGFTETPGGTTLCVQGSSMDVVLANLTITGGYPATSSNTPAGGIFVGDGASVALKNVTVTGNHGGGIHLGGNSVLVVGSGTVISSNTVTENGGGIFVGENATLVLSAGTISGNVATQGNGGGVYNAGTMLVYGSAVIGDKTATAAATYNSDNSTGDYSNRASSGGGIYNAGKLYIGYGLSESGAETPKAFTGGVYHNWAQEGGGIYQDGTDSEHSTAVNAGSIAYNGAASKGGGVHIQNGALLMTGGTISGNAVADGGSGSGVYFNETGSMSVQGGATVALGNDVYLSNNANSIGIAGALTADHVATITPASYDRTDAVIYLDQNSGTTLAAEHGRFSVTPQTSNGATIQWHVDSEGKLATP